MSNGSDGLTGHGAEYLLDPDALPFEFRELQDLDLTCYACHCLCARFTDNDDGVVVFLVRVVDEFENLGKKFGIDDDGRGFVGVKEWREESRGCEGEGSDRMGSQGQVSNDEFYSHL